MITLQTKYINFKIDNHLTINTIMNQKGTLFVKAFMSCEQVDCVTPIYWGYYEMAWLSTYKQKSHPISNMLRSKILEIFSELKLSEKALFELDEKIVYDFSYIQDYATPKGGS